MRPYVKLILGIQAAGYSNVSLKTVLSLNLFKPYTFSENFIKVLPAPPPSQQPHLASCNQTELERTTICKSVFKLIAVP